MLAQGRPRSRAPRYEQWALWLIALRRAGLPWARDLLLATGLPACVLEHASTLGEAYLEIQGRQPTSGVEADIERAVDAIRAACGADVADAFVGWALRHWVDDNWQLGLQIWGMALRRASLGHARTTPSAVARRALDEARLHIHRQPTPQDLVSTVAAGLGVVLEDDDRDTVKPELAELRGDLLSFEVEIDHERTFQALQSIASTLDEDGRQQFLMWAQREVEAKGYSAEPLGDVFVECRTPVC